MFTDMVLKKQEICFPLILFYKGTKMPGINKQGYIKQKFSGTAM